MSEESGFGLVEIISGISALLGSIFAFIIGILKFVKESNGKKKVLSEENKEHIEDLEERLERIEREKDSDKTERIGSARSRKSN